MENTSYSNRSNGFPDPAPQTKSYSSSNEHSAAKTGAGENSGSNPNDDFEKFRRMAAQIHQLFNAPYSKVINAAASTPSFNPSTSDGSQPTAANEKTRYAAAAASVQNKHNPTASFAKSWSIDQCAGRSKFDLVVPRLRFVSFRFSTEFLVHDAVSDAETVRRR